MKYDYLRSAWVNRSKPVTGPAFPGWAAIKRIVIHYPGADWADMDFNNDGDEDWEDTALLLDNTNNYYWTSPGRGYAIGYNAAADIFGSTWALRSSDFQCAANKGYNESSFAILVIVDGDAKATLAQVEAVRDLIAQIRVLAGWDIPIVGHGEVGQTSCPGLGIRMQIADGEFEPRPAFPVPVLKLGQRGERVLELRKHLHYWGYQKRPGRLFGPGTVRAMRRFQIHLGVKPTGRYDVATWRAYRKWVGQ